MNAELKVSDLEEAREKLRNKKAELTRRLISREAYFDESRFSKNEVIKLRNISIIYPAKKTRAEFSYEQSPETYSVEVSDFDGMYEALVKLFGKPALDFVWFGETYEFRDCKFELRSVRDSISYVVAYGKDEGLIKALKELDLKAELMENGAVSLIKKKG